MRNITLPILLLLTTFCSSAKSNLTDSTIQLADALHHTDFAGVSRNSNGLYSLPRYGRTPGGGVHFFCGVELGYSAGTMTESGKTSSGGGFMFGADLGAKIGMPTRSERRMGLVSISVGMNSVKIAKYEFGVVCLPVSYTSLGLGRDGYGRGFYWQAGVHLRYVAKGENPTGALTTVFADPCVGFGLVTPFRLVNRHSREDVGGGRIQFGPSFSYSPMNMLKNGGNMNGYMIGLKWQYIFM